MYYLLGLERNLETIAVVSKNFLQQSSKEISFGDFKEAYFKFTQYLNPCIPRPSTLHEICFVADEDLTNRLTGFFIEDVGSEKHVSGYQFQKICEKISLERKFTLIKKALDFYQKNNQDCSFLTNLLFSYICLIQSDNVICATTPKALGLLLMDAKEWSTWDICEMFVHETTHQLVSLDEYRYEHYSNILELNKIDNYALSAIRKCKRPLNKVVHSIVVAYEILEYRNQLAEFNVTINVHPATKILIEQIKESIKSINCIKHINELLMPRARSIIDHIEKKYLNFCE